MLKLSFQTTGLFSAFLLSANLAFAGEVSAHFKFSVLASLFLHGGLATGTQPRGCEEMFEDPQSWIDLHKRSEALATLRSFRERIGIRPHPSTAQRNSIDTYWQGVPQDISSAHLDKTRTDLALLEEDFVGHNENVFVEGHVVRGRKILAYLDSVGKVASALDQLALQHANDLPSLKGLSVGLTTALEVLSAAGIYFTPVPVNLVSGMLFAGTSLFAAYPLATRGYYERRGQNQLLDLKYRSHELFVRDLVERPDPEEAACFTRQFKAQPTYARQLETTDFDASQFVDHSQAFWASRYGLVGYLLYLNHRAQQHGGWRKSVAERKRIGELFNRDLYINHFISTENGEPVLGVYLRSVAYKKSS